MTTPEDDSILRFAEEQMADYSIEKKLLAIARPSVVVGNIISRVLNGNDWNPGYNTRVDVGRVTAASGAVALGGLAMYLFGAPLR